MFKLLAALSQSLINNMRVFNKKDQNRIFLITNLWIISLGCYAENINDQATSQINFAYMNYLGTGIYSAADRSVQVYHLPFSYTARETKVEKRGIKIRLPTTIGLLDFDARDIPINGLPDKLETLTFVPGVEFPQLMNSRWILSPLVDLGFGYDYTSGNLAWVYGIGVNSRLRFDYTNYKLTIFNEFLVAGNTTADENGTNDFSRFQTGLNLQFPLSFKFSERKTAISLYYLNYLYTNELEFLRIQNISIKVTMQNEIGITFDTKPDMNVLGIKFSKIGLGYQFGSNINVLRLIFGAPF